MFPAPISAIFLRAMTGSPSLTLRNCEPLRLLIATPQPSGMDYFCK
jgi:hypothetical protein